MPNNLWCNSSSMAAIRCSNHTTLLTMIVQECKKRCSTCSITLRATIMNTTQISITIQMQMPVTQTQRTLNTSPCKRSSSTSQSSALISIVHLHVRTYKESKLLVMPGIDLSTLIHIKSNSQELMLKKVMNTYLSSQGCSNKMIK